MNFDKIINSAITIILFMMGTQSMWSQCATTSNSVDDDEEGEEEDDDESDEEEEDEESEEEDDEENEEEDDSEEEEDDESEEEDDEENDEGNEDEGDGESEEEDEECDDDHHAQECKNPTNVSALVMNAYEVWIIWDDASAEEYIFSYRIVDGEWTEITSEETEIFLEDLEAGSEYEYMIQSVCEEAGIENSETLIFNTVEESEECSAPKVSDAFISANGLLIISWNEIEDASAYELRYRGQESNEEWEVITLEDNFIEAEHFPIDQNYEYQIRTLCDDEWTDWSSIYDLHGGSNSEVLSSILNLEKVDLAVAPMNVIVFPNPAKDVISFSYDSPNKTQLVIQLSDVQGAQHALMNESANRGKNTYKIDGNDLLSGVYLLSIRDMITQKYSVTKIMVFNN